MARNVPTVVEVEVEEAEALGADRDLQLAGVD